MGRISIEQMVEFKEQFKNEISKTQELYLEAIKETENMQTIMTNEIVEDINHLFSLFQSLKGELNDAMLYTINTGYEFNVLGNGCNKKTIGFSFRKNGYHEIVQIFKRNAYDRVLISPIYSIKRNRWKNDLVCNAIYMRWDLIKEMGENVIINEALEQYSKKFLAIDTNVEIALNKLRETRKAFNHGNGERNV